LDLCLSCKGCKSDCPVSVDMATYKAEFLSHHYRRRLRPPSAYSMGLIMFWARLAALAPGLANGVVGAPGLGGVVKRLGGGSPKTGGRRGWSAGRSSTATAITRR